MNKENIKKNAEISERISALIQAAGLTPNSFAKMLGYSRSQTVYDLTNGKCAPSYDFFRRFALSEISERYSLPWLLTGNGSMLADERATAANIPENFLQIICRQSEEIGRLRERVGQLERRLGKRVSSAPTFDTANVS